MTNLNGIPKTIVLIGKKGKRYVLDKADREWLASLPPEKRAQALNGLRFSLGMGFGGVREARERIQLRMAAASGVKDAYLMEALRQLGERRREIEHKRRSRER